MKSGHKRLWVFICWVVLLAMPVGAARYFVASDGDDAHTPAEAKNQATPWKTLTHVSMQSLIAGDTVLFRKNDTFPGTLTITASGTSTAPIVISSYGIGLKPIITGSRPLTGFTQEKTGLWSAPCSDTIRLLFMDGMPMTLARTPNHGYHTITRSLDSVAFLDTVHIGAANWTGSRIHIRTNQYTIETKNVAEYTSADGRFTLDYKPYGLYSKDWKGWGYFLNGLAQSMDTAGEWCWDSAEKRVLLMLRDEDVPASHVIEGSSQDSGIYINGSAFVVVESLAVNNIVGVGCRIYNGGHIVLRGMDFRYCDANAVYGDGDPARSVMNTIQGCTVYGTSNEGFRLYQTGGLIENNTVRATGLLGKTGWNKTVGKSALRFGINVEAGPDCIIRGNRIDSSGYIGICANGTRMLVERNFVTHSCLVLDDGAGLYIGGAGTVVRENIVLFSKGTPEGTPGSSYAASGIYLDDTQHAISVLNNTAAFCSLYGYLLHNTYDITFRNNLAFSNGTAGLALLEEAQHVMHDNLILGNVFTATLPTQKCLIVSSGAPFTEPLSTQDSNVYWSPYNKQSITYPSIPFPTPLENLQKSLSQDAASKDAGFTWPLFSIKDTVGAELVTNGNFSDGNDMWSCWNTVCSLDSNIGLDGKCLRVEGNGLAYPTIFSLLEGRQYLLRAGMMGQSYGTVNVCVRDAVTYGPFAVNSGWALETIRMDQGVVFSPLTSNPTCRVDFQLELPDSIFWLDNVSLREVRADTAMDTSLVRFYFNPTDRDTTIALASNYRLPNGTYPSVLHLPPWQSGFAYRDSIQPIALENQTGSGLTPALTLRPNPFNPTVEISLNGFPRSARPTVRILDIRGCFVAALSKQDQPISRLVWNAANQASGTYLLVVEWNLERLVKRLTLLR